MTVTACYKGAVVYLLPRADAPVSEYLTLGHLNRRSGTWVWVQTVFQKFLSFIPQEEFAQRWAEMQDS